MHALTPEALREANKRVANLPEEAGPGIFAFWDRFGAARTTRNAKRWC